MKKALAAGCIALAAALSLQAAPLPSVIKVGSAESLTGDNAVYGLSIRKGIELAIEELNASKFLGASRLSLVIYDDKADKQEGISVFNKLINDDKVAAIIGPTLSGTATAACPIAQQAGVPVIGTSLTAKGITEMGNFIFRDSLPQSVFVPGALAPLKAKYAPKKAALLFESTQEYTKSEAEVFKAALQAQGIELVATESYAKGDSDFRTQLAKMAAKKPDLLVLSCLAGEAVPILQQTREIGITAPIIGGNGFNTPAVLKSAAEAAEGLVVGAAWSIVSAAPKSVAFVAAYRKKYGAAPDQFAAQSYTAVYILATAIKNAGSADRAAIRDALAQVKDLDTPLGKFSFDQNRDPVHPSIALVVKGGKYSLFQ